MAVTCNFLIWVSDLVNTGWSTHWSWIHMCPVIFWWRQLGFSFSAALICFTVVSLLPQQQMAPRKVCWILSVHSPLSISCTVLRCCFLFSGVSCMAQDCLLRTPEDFVFPLLPSEELKDKYRRYLFRDYVEVVDFFSFKIPWVKSQMTCRNFV